MSHKEEQADNCGCGHHDHEHGGSHHMDGKCNLDSFADNLIEYLKKEFEAEEK